MQVSELFREHRHVVLNFAEFCRKFKKSWPKTGTFFSNGNTTRSTGLGKGFFSNFCLFRFFWLVNFHIDHTFSSEEPDLRSQVIFRRWVKNSNPPQPAFFVVVPHWSKTQMYTYDFWVVMCFIWASLDYERKQSTSSFFDAFLLYNNF